MHLALPLRPSMSKVKFTLALLVGQMNDADLWTVWYPRANNHRCIKVLFLNQWIEVTRHCLPDMCAERAVGWAIRVIDVGAFRIVEVVNFGRVDKVPIILIRCPSERCTLRAPCTSLRSNTLKIHRCITNRLKASNHSGAKKCFPFVFAQLVLPVFAICGGDGLPVRVDVIFKP